MSGEITAADVRDALLRLAGQPVFCGAVARLAVNDHELRETVLEWAELAARERATCAAEARAEGDR